MVKSSLANAGDARKMDLIPGSEDPLEEELTTHSSILAWNSSWTEEPGRLQSISLACSLVLFVTTVSQIFNAH